MHKLDALLQCKELLQCILLIHTKLYTCCSCLRQFYQIFVFTDCSAQAIEGIHKRVIPFCNLALKCFSSFLQANHFLAQAVP
jgi:hypothetical protein